MSFSKIPCRYCDTEVLKLAIENIDFQYVSADYLLKELLVASVRGPVGSAHPKK